MNNKLSSMFAMTILLLATTISADAQGFDGKYFPYEEFITKIEAGVIKSVELSEYSGISGTYEANGQEKPFSTYHGEATDDPLPLKLLQENNVEIKLNVRDEFDDFGGGAMFAGLAMMFIPMLMFLITILVLVYVLILNSKVNKLIQLEEIRVAQQES